MRSLLDAIGRYWLIPSLLLAGLSGCVSSHEDGDYVSATASVSYSGYAEKSDPVIIEALNRHLGVWTEVAHTTSGSQPIRYGGVTMYRWIARFRLADRTDWRCYTSPSCVFTEGASMSLRVRTLLPAAPNGMMLYTYDRGAYDCTTGLVQSGQSLVAAYDECMNGQRKRELTLWVHP